MGWSTVSQRQDRLGGVLLGLAAGDALGAPYEFHTSVDAAAAEPIGGGLGPWAPGEWTDDTQMAICIAEVTATGSRDVEAIGERFLHWYADGPLDIGNQTRVVLGGAPSAAALRESAATYLQRHPSQAAGNGSLMRTAPVALACLGDDAALAALARAVSELTHADPLAGDACVLWCVAVDRAVREDRLDGAWDGLDLLGGDARRHWRERLAEAETQPPEAFVPNGFVVAALQAAYAAVRQTPVPADRPGAHLEAALRRAVGIGHDTDTVAAIAGALLGARWGWSAIPQRWLRILHGWPDLRAEDLLDLALRTASGGDDDAAGQPGAALPRAHDSMSDPTPPRVGAAAGDDGPPPDTAIDDPPPDTAIDDPPDPPAEALDWDRVLAWQPAIAPERLAAVERRTGGAQDPWGGRAWSGLARDLLRDLDEVGVVAPFDWSAWLQHRGEALLDDASALSDASLEDCRRLLAALARSDRFVEGAWDAALERGTVQAVLGRVAALRGEATSTHRRGAPGRG